MNADYVAFPALLFAVALSIDCFFVLRAKRRPAAPPRRTRLIHFALGLFAFVMSALAVSSVYNALRMHLFWAKHPAPGQRLSVAGQLMHIHCTGSGSPTVILDAGLGNEAISWAKVQILLSQTNRVCSYDRAGFGWSDPSTSVRDADHIAADLHGLLREAGVRGPLVLAAHSLAGLYSRDYATRYPEDVVGLVFIDASTPRQEQDPVMKRTTTKSPPAWLLHAAMIAGVPRLIHMCSPHVPSPSETQRVQSEAYCRVHFNSITQEAQNQTLSGDETAKTGPYAIPVLILSHDPATNVGPHPRPNDLDHEQAWTRLQEDLKRLSTHSRRIVVLGTTHSLITQRPDAISNSIEELLAEVRSVNKSVIFNGTTIAR